jgi:hypothetical protein
MSPPRPSRWRPLLKLSRRCRPAWCTCRAWPCRGALRSCRWGRRCWGTAVPPRRCCGTTRCVGGCTAGGLGGAVRRYCRGTADVQQGGGSAVPRRERGVASCWQVGRLQPGARVLGRCCRPLAAPNASDRSRPPAAIQGPPPMPPQATDEVVLEADRDYSAGDPVLAWCGPQPNSRLLINYGLVDEANPYDKLPLTGGWVHRAGWHSSHSSSRRRRRRSQHRAAGAAAALELRRRPQSSACCLPAACWCCAARGPAPAPVPAPADPPFLPSLPFRCSDAAQQRPPVPPQVLAPGGH